MYHLIVINDSVPTVTIKMENGLFLASEVLDWYAEVYDFDRSKLSGAVVQQITYDIDKDEVRKRKLDEHHKRQVEINKIFQSGISANVFGNMIDVEEFEKLTS